MDTKYPITACYQRSDIFCKEYMYEYNLDYSHDTHYMLIIISGERARNSNQNSRPNSEYVRRSIMYIKADVFRSELA